MFSSKAVIRRGGPVRPAIFGRFTSPDAAASDNPEALDPTVQIAEAQARAEELGYANGYTSGYEQGRAAADAELRTQIDRLRGLVDAAVHDVQATLNELEPTLVELALAIAERVIECELADRRDTVAEVVRVAIHAAGTLPVVRVRVHPDDHALVEAVWPDLTRASGDGKIDLVADPELQPGGCVVDTASGLIDAQPATRLAEIREQILARIGATDRVGEELA